MKRSEKIALWSIVFGVAVGGGLDWYTDGVLWTWLYWVLGLAAAGTSFQTWLSMTANQSIIDSRTVNRK
jgi:hypothetical protein